MWHDALQWCVAHVAAHKGKDEKPRDDKPAASQGVVAGTNNTRSSGSLLGWNSSVWISVKARDLVGQKEKKRKKKEEKIKEN